MSAVSLSKRMLNGIAVLLLAAGLWWTAASVRAAPARVVQVLRKADHLSQLRKMQAGLAAERNALAAFEPLAGKRPANLREMAAEALPGVAVEIRPRETRPAAAGWTVRSADVLLADVPLQHVAGFLRAAESRRPPWRLTECQIAASDRTSGSGRVSLVLETMEKTAAAP